MSKCIMSVDDSASIRQMVKAFKAAWKEGDPYDLICMDIMMPAMNGHESLKMIRDLEKEMGIVGSTEARVIMVTALEDPKNVIEAFYREGATSYLVKPVTRQGAQ